MKTALQLRCMIAVLRERIEWLGFITEEFDVDCIPVTHHQDCARARQKLAALEAELAALTYLPAAPVPALSGRLVTSLQPAAQPASLS